MTAFAVDDPFASSEKSPAISFNKAPVGKVITVVVSEPAKKIQGKKFNSDQPAVWENKDGSTSPKYSAVINGVNAETAEPCSIWATIPSDLFVKLKDAQQALGRGVQPGDTIAIKFTGEEPTAGEPKKIYAVKITPGQPKAPAGSDPFGDSTPAAAPAAAPSGGGNKFPDEVPPW